MKTLKHYAAFVAGSVMLLLAVRCANMNPANTSEVGNPKLTGRLIDGRTSTPAQGAIVRVYPVYLNKMAQALGKVANNAPAIDSTKCDHNGAYQFDSLDQGIYSIEGEKIDGTDTLTMRHPSVVFVASKDLGCDTLQLPGWIKGKVLVPSGESAKNITCYIPGTSYIAITNDTGGFKITGIPVGTYSLSITSTRFNDTTIYGLKVTQNHETPAGNILLGLDRSKNEHDVWGVFDTTYNIKAIDSIEARVSGDSIPADSPRIYKLDWRPSLFGYSGFIYVPDGGFFWNVDVWVFDTLGRRIGAYRVPTINRATGDVQVPNFNPFNSIPVITLHDTTVSIYDTIRLHAVITTLADDSIVSMAWKIGSAGTFTNTTKKDTVIIAPKDSGIINCVFRVTDKFRNTAADTVIDSVITDPPIFTLGNDTTVSVGANLTFSANVQQRFGSVVMYTWNYQGDTTWTDSGSQHTKSITFKHLGEQHLICEVKDDDKNLIADTVNIWVATELGGLINKDLTLRESESPYVVKGDITVATGVKLTIEPGTLVRINPDKGIVINGSGSFFAEGTALKRIVFTVNSSDATTIGGTMTLDNVSSFHLKYCDLINMEAITPNDGTPWDCIGDTIILDSCRVINFSSLTFNAQVYGLIRGNIFQQGGNCNFWNDGWIIEGNRFVGIGGVSFFGGNQTITANSFSGSYLGFDGWGRNSGYSTTISLNNISDGGGIGCLTYGVFLSISSNNISGGGNILVNGNGQIINNTVENAEGSGITACGIWTIYGNAITTSKQSGIFLTGAAGINVVSHNTVTGNGFGTLPTAPPYVNAGIACMDSLFTIDSNIVTGNSNGVICPSGSIVINNDIHDNTNYDFMVAIYGITDVNAYNNWWGTTDTVQIHAKIYDYIGYQNSSRALIDPVAPAEIPGAGVR